MTRATPTPEPSGTRVAAPAPGTSTYRYSGSGGVHTLDESRLAWHYETTTKLRNWKA